MFLPMSLFASLSCVLFVLFLAVGPSLIREFNRHGSALCLCLCISVCLCRSLRFRFRLAVYSLFCLLLEIAETGYGGFNRQFLCLLLEIAEPGYGGISRQFRDRAKK